MLAAHVLVEVINLVLRLELLLEKTLQFDRRELRKQRAVASDIS